MSERKASQPMTTSRIDWEYHCPNCKRGFNADMTHQVDLISETEAELMCSWCKHTARYEPPAPENIKRPPAIVDHTLRTDEQGLTVARLFFEGGTWIQYRQTSDGCVYEEIVTPDGKTAHATTAEHGHHDHTDFETLYDHPETYLARTIEQYERFTVRGLRIQKPYVAAVLVSEA